MAEHGPLGIATELTSVARLLGTLVPHARDAVVGAIDDTALHLKQQAERLPVSLSLPMARPRAAG